MHCGILDRSYMQPILLIQGFLTSFYYIIPDDKYSLCNHRQSHFINLFFFKSNIFACSTNFITSTNVLVMWVWKICAITNLQYSMIIFSKIHLLKFPSLTFTPIKYLYFNREWHCCQIVYLHVHAIWILIFDLPVEYIPGTIFLCICEIVEKIWIVMISVYNSVGHQGIHVP